jgi:hypothetical protein
MKTHRHHARTLELTFKPKYQILSITFPVQLNPWRRVAETGCKQFPVVRARVWKLYAVALLRTMHADREMGREGRTLCAADPRHRACVSKPAVRRGGVSLTFAPSLRWRGNSEAFQQMPRGIPLLPPYANCCMRCTWMERINDFAYSKKWFCVQQKMILRTAKNDFAYSKITQKYYASAYWLLGVRMLLSTMSRYTQKFLCMECY